MEKRKIIKVLSGPLLFMLTIFLYNGCFTSKKMSTANIPVVEQFSLQSYLGKWYEIARLPNKFEKGIDFVTAEYSLKEDGTVKVVNKGFKSKKNEWKEAVGKAKIPNPETPAFLKVSFFWIFYADYKIIALDEKDYSYAMVTSNSKEYLWILSRTPEMEETIYDQFTTKAKTLGFETEKLYKVNHMGMK